MSKNTNNYRIELDVAIGLEAVAHEELIQLLGKSSLRNVDLKKGAIQFSYGGALERLMHLRTVEAAYLLQVYDVPRPKALLGDQNFRQLIADIETAFNASGRENFDSLYLNAAGSDSSVMQRIKSDIAQLSGLSIADDAGDLLLRIRKSEGKWDVLTRLTPRPLATRSWRICDYEGALNAPLAQAMCRLVEPFPQDMVINLMCGSGTLMAEFLLSNPSHEIIGIDNDPEALQCARQNLTTAHLPDKTALLLADVVSLPFPDEFAAVLFADFPFGNLVGSHDNNVKLYPEILREAARICKPDARFVLITHEVNLILSALNAQDKWELYSQLRVSQRGLTPILCVLQRSYSN